MAVTSQLTTFSDFEGTPTLVGYAGGQGAVVNDDVIIQGAQSAGRRVDNITNKGFGVSVTAADMSAANTHVKIWLFITQWSSVTQVQCRISSGADDDHELPTAEYPPLFGWIPVWIDVSRTPEAGGSANEASISEIGVLIDIGDVGGNAPNLIEDEILYGTSGYLWSGASGSLADFRTFENTNNEGVLVTINGVDFCYARLELGDSVATGFTDSGFTLIFPDQSLVSDTFMGVTCDLQNASTDLNLTDSTIQSADPSTAGKRPDFIVTGTAGALDLVSVNLLGMRTLDLTSACTIDGGILDLLNLTQSAAEIKNATIRTRAATQVAVVDDATFGTTSGIHDCDFEQADAGHAIELTSTAAISLTGIGFNGYGGTPGSNLVANSGANDAAIYNNSGGAVTINILGGGDTPSIRNGAGSTTTVVASVPVTLTVVDASDGSPIQGANILLEEDPGGTDIIFDVLTGVNGQVTASFSGATPQDVTGFAAKGTKSPVYKRQLITGTITSAGFNQTVPMVLDE